MTAVCLLAALLIVAAGGGCSCSCRREERLGNDARNEVEEKARRAWQAEEAENESQHERQWPARRPAPGDRNRPNCPHHP